MAISLAVPYQIRQFGGSINIIRIKFGYSVDIKTVLNFMDITMSFVWWVSCCFFNYNA